ncbi:pyridoxal phosphate-dependent transferase [Stachybotrys elegans]|uniref:Kynureninase n=1 Tax=Stachybotrys elegans TaxID=80388 RepID=A0A8K0SXB3_9HYPO|nr:pyridoxal phosphate-dependent transferase [Stachybotrys elegans]
MSNTSQSSLFESLRTKAQSLDAKDSIQHIRNEFIIPTKADIKRKTLQRPVVQDIAVDQDETTACTYLCGNSLGLQPKRTALRIKQFLDTWATQGVQGHFKPLDDSPLPPWLHVDDWAAKLMAPIVGASASEVAVMQTLTVNLHLLMNAFYRPDPNGRHKIVLESKAFPSDHYAVWSQVRQHGLSPETSVVFIESQESDDELLSTHDIQSVILKHAKDTALIVLPGVQYYTGQLLDIPGITAFAHSHGIAIIWDLAHAVGNVPLLLHDWDVDAAAWCHYKYLNGGAGCIGGLFVHSSHSTVTTAPEDPAPANGYRHRLAGWWGNNKATRFAMKSQFHPSTGAAGFQISNPSALDITALGASLEVVAEAGGVSALRAKSLPLTRFLHDECLAAMSPEARRLFRCITPSDPEQRGAQLSLRLVRSELLETVMEKLEEHAVIIDERRPDVIRVAPCPLYNTFGDCVDFAVVFEGALLAADAVTSASA